MAHQKNKKATGHGQLLGPGKAIGIPGSLGPVSTVKPANPAQGAPSLGGAIKPYDPRIDAVYNDTLTGLGTQRDITKGDLDYDATTGGNRYGLTAAYNADGTPSGNYSVDPSDPFSKMALLQRSYESAKRGTTNSLASQGQLYSGAMRNAQTQNDTGFAQGKDALSKAFSDLLMATIRGKRGADSDYLTGAGTAARTRLDSQLGGGF